MDAHRTKIRPCFYFGGGALAGSFCLALVAALAACAASDAPASPGVATDDAGAPSPPTTGAGADGGAGAGDADTSPDALPPPPASDGSTAEAGAGGAYDTDGPVTFKVTTESVTNGSSSFTLNVYMPDSPGPHPIVSLSPGLLQPAVAYVPYAQRLASYGIAVLVRDDPGLLIGSQDLASDVGYVVATWMPATLGAKVDLTRVGLAGHSRGGMATLLAAEHALKGKVESWLGLDPVDVSTKGGDPLARDGVGTLGIPTAYIGASVTSSCAPASANYAVLYAATSAPSVQITAVGAGHTELEDTTHCSACNLCTPAGTADAKTVLAYSVRYATAFFARELLGDAKVGAAFEGAGVQADVAAGRVQIASK